MFDYLRNEYNPHPVLTTDREAATSTTLVRYLPFSTSHVLVLPSTPEELRALRGRRFWSAVRRSERKLAPGLELELCTTAAQIEPWLPAVQRLYAERWADEYTGLGWDRESGFRPYADAMVDLAGRGRALLVLLRSGDELLSFAYCLIEAPWVYFYQHATTRREPFAQFSPGTVLLARLVERLTGHPELRYFDMMLGDAEYKRHWATYERTVYRRLARPRTVTGRARLLADVALHRSALYVRFGHPGLRRAAKAALRTADRFAARVVPDRAPVAREV